MTGSLIDLLSETSRGRRALKLARRRYDREKKRYARKRGPDPRRSRISRMHREYRRKRR